MFRQLAFASRARPGLRAAHTSDLIGISRSNNVRDGVTGVLLYTGESFLELVEGRDTAISALWRRILIDDRHRGVVILFDVTGRERAFQQWRAGYVAEGDIGADVERWRSLTPGLAAGEIDRIRALLGSAETF